MVNKALRRVAMIEERAASGSENTEVRCDVCRKTFPTSEQGKQCPECKIGRLWLMEKAVS
jgi:Zn finger protein HypA/HybF involved in hydrogenase expression